jgi:hypothetical protein
VLTLRYVQLWSVSNLTSLSVKHAAFLRQPPSVVQFSRVLRNSPSLEVLFTFVLFLSADAGIPESHTRGA